jgi:hypothetical protein
MLEPFTPSANAKAVMSDEPSRLPTPTLWLSSAKDRPNVIFKLSEARLVRAYLALILVPWTMGTRSVPLARYGAYEVRLVEFEHDIADAGPPLWLELLCRDTNEAIDACGCDEFETAVRIAQDFMMRASELRRCARA